MMATSSMHMITMIIFMYALDSSNFKFRVEIAWVNILSKTTTQFEFNTIIHGRR